MPQRLSARLWASRLVGRSTHGQIDEGLKLQAARRNIRRCRITLIAAEQVLASDPEICRLTSDEARRSMTASLAVSGVRIRTGVRVKVDHLAQRWAGSQESAPDAPAVHRGADQRQRHQQRADENQERTGAVQEEAILF